MTTVAPAIRWSQGSIHLDIPAACVVETPGDVVVPAWVDDAMDELNAGLAAVAANLRDKYATHGLAVTVDES